MAAARPAFVVVALGTLTLWLAWAGGVSWPGGAARPAEATPPSPDAAPGQWFDAAGQTRRLEAARARAVEPVEPQRNPFQFQASSPRPASAVARPREVMSRPPAPPVPAGNDAGPPFALVGVAERRRPDGLVRVAILAGHRDLFLAEAGTELEHRYRVVAVETDAVEIEDRRSGARTRIGLKKP